MNRQAPIRPEDAPGHYGAGYGEQVPEDAPPRPAPATDDENRAGAPTTPGTSDISPASGTSGKGTSGHTGTSGDSGAPDASPGGDGESVVFTPADVSARPPDHTPTENAPASEKAGLIFERS